MKIEIRNNCSDFNTYRAARVKSLFNCESGADFSLDADLPLEDAAWKIGVVVGPSGSGKTSIGRSIWPDVGIYDGDQGWAADKPIVECIAPSGGFDDVTGALSAVGLGSVPAWLRPYHALSNGEKFRAGLARVIAEGARRRPEIGALGEQALTVRAGHHRVDALQAGALAAAGLDDFYRGEVGAANAAPFARRRNGAASQFAPSSGHRIGKPATCWSWRSSSA